MTFARLVPVALFTVCLHGCSGVGGAGDGGDTDTGMSSGPGVPGNAEDCPTNHRGDCVVASDACSPDNLQTDADGSACAQCVEDDVVFEICGERTSVFCSQLEDAFGAPCQRCATPEIVLYDDCVLASVAEGGVTCEEVAVGQRVEGAADDGQSIIADDSETCEVCYDSEGHVVSSACRPEADSCETETIGGRLCERCTFEGEFAYLECEDLDLDPEVCEIYGNDDGRCIDCYADNALILHTCVFGDPSERERGFCQTYDTLDGLVCTECFDEDGNVASFSCEEPSWATFCQELIFDEARQKCTVCVDGDGDVTEAECVDLACLETGAVMEECINTTPCVFVELPDGQLCRECPIEGFQDDAVERECLSNGDDGLMCDEEWILVERPVDADHPEDGSVVEQVRCVRCYDPAGELVHEECDDVGGEPSPPLCSYEIQADGSECLVCTNSETGDVVYECQDPEPVCVEDVIDDQLCLICDDQIVECEDMPLMCSSTSGVQLFGSSGETLTFQTTEGDELPAVVDCEECVDPGTDSDELALARCSLRGACPAPPPDPDEPGAPDDDMPPSSEPRCMEFNLWTFNVPQCGSPWLVAADNPVPPAVGSDDDVQQAMSWLIGLGLVPQQVVIERLGPAEECASCACDSGRQLKLLVTPNDVVEPELIEYGFIQG